MDTTLFAKRLLLYWLTELIAAIHPAFACDSWSEMNDGMKAVVRLIG
jgi:hypothetical protein